MCMADYGDPSLFTEEVPVPEGQKCSECGAPDAIEGRRWIESTEGSLLLIDGEPRAWSEKYAGDLDDRYQDLSEWVAENDEAPPSFVPSKAIEDFHSFRCARCKAGSRWLVTVCGGYLWDCVAQDIVEHWTEDTLYRNHAFGRLVLAARAGWQRKGTRLAPDTGDALVDAAIARVDTGTSGYIQGES